jgi:anti-sigma factor ChrR (cupin superfamily)
MSAQSITALAARIGQESGAAMDAALRERAAQVAGQLEEASAKAAGASREAAMQLRDQLAKVNELAGNLERRVAHARNRAEEQVDHDFARRVALITESLNSNAIDIARALDSDVTDTAWAAYLKGDRGIFTRRAVRLLDAPEAKAVAQLYEADRDFRDHVSRYIHDFEAMLRQLLSTRDGHAVGVTLLSSDMGKLYVALAQAIERLRN